MRLNHLWLYVVHVKQQHIAWSQRQVSESIMDQYRRIDIRYSFFDGKQATDFPHSSTFRSPSLSLCFPALLLFVLKLILSLFDITWKYTRNRNCFVINDSCARFIHIYLFHSLSLSLAHPLVIIPIKHKQGISKSGINLSVCKSFNVTSAMHKIFVVKWRRDRKRWICIDLNLYWVSDAQCHRKRWRCTNKTKWNSLFIMIYKYTNTHTNKM